MRCQKQLLLKCIYGISALLVLDTIIFYYYQPNYSLLNIPYDENIGIEQALKQMSVCTSEDRPRQYSLLHTLHAWTKFARKHHIQYWISYGSLVGYIQRRGLLPHDEDVDIFIMGQESSHLFELSRFNISSTYRLVVHPQWFIIGESNRSYFESEGIDFIAPDARFINIENGLHVDIWPIYDHNPDATRLYKDKPTMLAAYGNSYEWVLSPKEWTFPLQECIFSGIKVWCPAEPAKLVSHFYNEVSVNISSITCENGSWVSSQIYKMAKKLMKMNNQITNSTPAQLSNTTIKSGYLNNYTLIDSVLEQIPTCNSEDRSRQRNLLATLQAWSYLAEAHNLHYWLTFESLIGYVQRGGLLPHNRNLHITMMVDDTPQLLNISQTNFSSKYQLKVHPQWNIVGAQNRSSFPEEGIDFVTSNARLINLKSNSYIDILPAYNFDPLSSIKSQDQNLTVYDSNYNWLSYPKDWTYPLLTCYFSKIKVLCPADPKMLVKTMYNTKALTKSDTKCENGTWVKTIDEDNT